MTGRQQESILDALTVLEMPNSLPSAHRLLEACARGYASIATYGDVAVFDYTADGLADQRARAIVQSMRGLVVDLQRPTDPVLAWPSQPIYDLRIDSVINRAPESVQRKVDGLLMMRTFRDGAATWVPRRPTADPTRVAARAAALWPTSPSTSLPNHHVAYVEFCGPGLETPTAQAVDQIYLLDVVDRRDGSAWSESETADFAMKTGILSPESIDWPGSLERLGETLRTAPASDEGYVLRWSTGQRARLVNPLYELLWNLCIEPSLGAVVDSWRSPRRRDVLAAVDGPTHVRLVEAFTELDERADLSGPTAGAWVFLATHGGAKTQW